MNSRREQRIAVRRKQRVGARCWWRVLVTCLAGGLAGSASGQVTTLPPDSRDSLVAQAMNTVFHPNRGLEPKSMGLFQYTLHDLLPRGEQKLQVMLAVDATSSMSQALDQVQTSIHHFAEDLHLRTANRAEFALLSFYDIGLGVEEVVAWNQQVFSPDASALARAVSSIQLKSGRPYFPEAVDQAIHQALNAPGWEGDENSVRLLLVFTDAPPYDPNFRDADTPAIRHVESQVLIDAAQRRQIKVCFFLCPSRPEEREVAAKVLVKTRSFMNEIAGATGGFVVDLTEPAVRQQVVDAARAPRYEFSEIQPISQTDIDAHRERERPVALTQMIRAVVLPEASLAELRVNDPAKKLLAAALRRELAQVITVVPGPLTESYLREILLQNPRSMEEVWQALLHYSDANYVIGPGTATPPSLVAYSANLQQISVPLNPRAALPNEGTEARRLASALEPLGSSSTALFTQAHLTDEQATIASAYRQLEQSLYLNPADVESTRLLEAARETLQNKAWNDPLVYHLLASVHYNLFRRYEAQGDKQAAESAATNFRLALGNAREMTAGRNDEAAREIEADWMLFNDRTPSGRERVMDIYRSLRASRNPARALRARWMLAGLYLGDWGVSREGQTAEEKANNGTAARQELLDILAFWPDSAEARAIQYSMLWDPVRKTTRIAALPLTHNRLAELVTTGN